MKASTAKRLIAELHALPNVADTEIVPDINSNDRTEFVVAVLLTDGHLVESERPGILKRSIEGGMIHIPT